MEGQLVNRGDLAQLIAGGIVHPRSHISLSHQGQNLVDPRQGPLDAARRTPGDDERRQQRKQRDRHNPEASALHGAIGTLPSHLHALVADGHQPIQCRTELPG